MNDLRIETVEIASLTFDPTNARKHDGKNIEAIAGSLKLFGQRKPIVVTPDNIVVAGNGTLEAAKTLGWSEIVIARTPIGWTWDQIKAFALADNSTAELAEWDDKILADQLLELDANGWALEEFGFEALEPFPYPDENEDEPLSFDDAPTRSKLGDLWQVGEHKIYCGDSLNEDSYKKLLAGKQAQMLHTDPPYGVDYEGVNNDHLKGEKFREFLATALKLAFNNLQDGSNAYMWHSDIHAYEAIGAYRDAGFTQAKPPTIQWVKDSLVLSQGDYHSRNEPCLYGWKQGAGRIRVEDRTQDTIWEYPKPKKAEGHPTMKPIDLCARAINNSSKKGFIVLDPFAGSGSTLVACVKTQRVGYGIELDPKYVDVILDRLEKQTGLEAQLLED
jgi:DNA modification methylase